MGSGQPDTSCSKLCKKRSCLRLFSGTVQCGCGKKMYPKDHNTTYTCYKDLTKVQEIFLEHYLLDGITAMFSSSMLELLISRALDEVHAKQLLLDETNRQLAEVKIEMEKCYKAFMSERLDDEDFTHYYTPLKSKSRVLQAQLTVLKSEIDSLNHHCLSNKILTKNVQEITRKWWPTADLDMKKWFVENYIKKIIVNENLISIEFQHLAPLRTEDGIDLTAFNLLCGLKVNIQLEGNVHDEKVIRSSADSYKLRSEIKKVSVA